MLSFVFMSIFSSAYGLVAPMNTEDVLDTFDLIVLGTIIDVKRQDNMPTAFQIEIKESIKPDSFDQNTITAFGCKPNQRVMGVPCPNYNIGDQGLFLIQGADDGYELSFRSRVSGIDCTAEQFLSTYRDFGANFYWTQNGQSDIFFTGESVDIHFIAYNKDLEEKDYSIQFMAGTRGSTFTDIVNGTIGECTGYKKITTSFVPTKMGTYSFGERHDTGGSSSYGTAIIDYGSSPREQFEEEVHGQEVWCRRDCS